MVLDIVLELLDLLLALEFLLEMLLQLVALLSDVFKLDLLGLDDRRDLLLRLLEWSDTR